MTSDVPTCKKNLFEWLSVSVDHLNNNKAGVRHCWEQTLLLKAWERNVQVTSTPGAGHTPRAVCLC